MPIGDCLWLLIDDVDNGLDGVMKYYENIAKWKMQFFIFQFTNQY